MNSIEPSPHFSPAFYCGIAQNVIANARRSGKAEIAACPRLQPIRRCTITGRQNSSPHGLIPYCQPFTLIMKFRLLMINFHAIMVNDGKN